MKILSMIIFSVREAILRGTLIFYFAVGNLIILFVALAVNASPDGSSIVVLGNPIPAKSLMGVSPVDFILIQLQRSSASAIMFLGIFAIAGIIPSMLEKGTAELFLSKPLSRTTLFLSRAIGSTVAIGLNILYFAVAIWLIFGVKIGVWHWGFLLSALMVVVAFAFYYSVVALVSLVTRSQALAIMLGFLFWFLAGALESRQAGLYNLWSNDIYRRTLDVIYYVTPQVSGMLQNATRLIGMNPYDRMLGPQAVSDFSIMPFVFSLLSASAIYALASWYFSRQDY
ncbi:MAG: hypothetical protein FJ217_02925 [Ignavibacteria bacterium]|nr:hypothetical protein [Ignavibacteria bacterium]